MTLEEFGDFVTKNVLVMTSFSEKLAGSHCGEKKSVEVQLKLGWAAAQMERALPR